MSPSDLKVALLDYVSKMTSILLLKSEVAGVQEMGKKHKQMKGIPEKVTASNSAARPKHEVKSCLFFFSPQFEGKKKGTISQWHLLLGVLLLRDYSTV